MKVGDRVRKISGEPFKNGKKTQVIVSFGYNLFNPNIKSCAFFNDGSSCNLDQLEFVGIPSTDNMEPTEYLCCVEYQIVIQCVNRVTRSKWFLKKLIPLTSVWSGEKWVDQSRLDCKFFDSPEAAWEEYWNKIQ